MKSDYRVRAEKLIRKVYPYIKNCRTPDGVRKHIEEYNKEHHSKILVRNGAARLRSFTLIMLSSLTMAPLKSGRAVVKKNIRNIQK